MSLVTPDTRTAAAARPDRLEVRTSPLLGGGPLVRDYLAGRDLSAFYTGHFTDPAAYERKATEVAARLNATSRARVADAIEPLGDARSRLDSILKGNGFFITTGQQPALFGGPLYTLYKILGAIRLADALERRLSRPVLALFWVGSDDHDWDEANHSALIDPDHHVRRITVRAQEDLPPLPLSARAWGPGIEDAVDEFLSLLPDTVHADEIAAHVREAYRPELTVTQSFTATIRWLLHDRRVAIIDSAHPSLRRAAADIMRVEAERSVEHARVLQHQTGRVESLGYAAQVDIAPDASNLMLIDEQGRDRLIRTGRGWRTRRTGGFIAEDRLLELIETRPDSFSPNVLLRPVVESAVLPTIAYVAGPGELSYFSQIGCLFQAHGILPPIVVPRPSVTLIEPKVRQVLDRLGMQPDELRRPFREVVADLISAEMPADVQRSLDALRESIATGYDELASVAERIDPVLRSALNGGRNASLLEVNAAEKRIRAQLRRVHEVRIEQLRRAAAHVQPGGAPQERVLGPLPFVAAEGRELVERIEAAIDLEPSGAASWEGPDCPTDW